MVINFEPMTEAEFDEAAATLPDPIECQRCGKWLYSRASIVRGYGLTCAFLAALEGLSHAGRNPKAAFQPKPTVEFIKVNDDRWQALDYRGLAVGEVKRANANAAWHIILWSKKVDLDADFESAKRRLVRILERMVR